MDFVFECRRIVFDWKGSGLEFFRNDTGLSPKYFMREKFEGYLSCVGDVGSHFCYQQSIWNLEFSQNS